MPHDDKEDRKRRARDLFARGLAKTEIAREMGVSPSTVYRWAREDREDGNPWSRRAAPCQRASRQPESPAPDRDRLRRRLHARLQALVERAEREPDEAKLEQRMLKLCRVLEHLQPEASDPKAQLEALDRFATFCAQNLCEDELDPVRRALRIYMDHLKEVHS